jgi:hypothetical protein
VGLSATSVQVSPRGREILQGAIQELGIEVQEDGTLTHHKFGVEVLGRPIAQAPACPPLSQRHPQAATL